MPACKLYRMSACTVGDVDKVIGNQAAAELIGVKRSTWEAYRARGQAPEPDLPPTIEAGKARPTWRRRTIESWHASRPGRGWRKEER